MSTEFTDLVEQYKRATWQLDNRVDSVLAAKVCAALKCASLTDAETLAAIHKAVAENASDRLYWEEVRDQAMERMQQRTKEEIEAEAAQAATPVRRPIPTVVVGPIVMGDLELVWRERLAKAKQRARAELVENVRQLRHIKVRPASDGGAAVLLELVTNDTVRLFTTGNGALNGAGHELFLASGQGVLGAHEFSLTKYLPLDTDAARQAAREYVRRTLVKFVADFEATQAVLSLLAMPSNA
jgi:hypothetical protein